VSARTYDGAAPLPRPRNRVRAAAGSIPLALLLFAASIVSGQQPAFRTIDKGTQSNVDSARQAVAKTAADFATLWKTHNYDKAVPAVDFSREIVVAVFMGSRPTGGFSVEITSVTESGGDVVVGYRERAPAADVVTAQVLTSPFHIVAIPKTEGRITFKKV
jgi:hypothetical protein